MPEARCSSCQSWTPRQDWRDAPGQTFAFRIVCPRCGAELDVSEIDVRLVVAPDDED